MDILVDNQDIRIERLELGRWETNSYIVVCPQTGHSAIIDVPSGARTIVKRLQGTIPQYILLTHSHIDHIAGLPALKGRIGAPLAVHAADQEWLSFPPQIRLSDGDILSLGKLKIEVLHTPGHTPGSLCFRIKGYLISGDTIFPGGPGRTESPADFRQIVKSLAGKIFTLPDDTQVYPGHGASTSLKKEKSQFANFSSRPHDRNLHGDVVWLST